MPASGRYIPDITEGITRVEDLPQPVVVRRSRNYRRRLCPKCQRSAYRLRTALRRLSAGSRRRRPPTNPPRLFLYNRHALWQNAQG